MPVSKQVLITNQRGLHARASAKFVDMAASFDADIHVQRGDEVVAASSIMDLLMLAAGPGTEITILADGPDADAALAALIQLVEDKFYESV
ncbi:HPr family phosphocarrier protein [Hyphobacterium sp.]|uniref:HPr family phosphocarrier protein n=1 Tax=Hyphobacterium sp. TaxID=2004662 RepID=UPI003749F24F